MTPAIREQTVSEDIVPLKESGASTIFLMSSPQKKECLPQPGGRQSFELEGSGIELVVGSLLGDELIVGAALYYPSVIQDHDAVAVTHC